MHDPYAPESIDFRRPRLAGDVLSDSLAFVRDHFVDLGKGLLYIVGPVLVVVVVLSSLIQQQSLAANPLFNPAAEMDPAFFGTAYFISLGLMVAVWVLVYAVGFAYVFLYMEGLPGPITVPELWGETKRLLAPVFLTSLGLMLLFIVSMVIFIIPRLGALAWAAGWIYLTPAASLVVPARLIDERDFFSAFRRARHLVEGYWAQTFGVLLLVGVVSFVLALVLSLPVIVFSFVAGFHGAAETGPFMQGVLTLGSVVSALGYFIYVLTPVAATMHYFNLVTKQEGAAVPDLEDRIDAIGRNEDAAWDDAGWDEEADAERRW